MILGAIASNERLPKRSSNVVAHRCSCHIFADCVLQCAAKL